MRAMKTVLSYIAVIMGYIFLALLLGVLAAMLFTY
jgi:hypothetical protein